MPRKTADDTHTLGAFASDFPYCALCWGNSDLHIHHLVGGAGRKHDRRNLLRLCARCHEGLHSGGVGYHVTPGMCLNAKRLVDPDHYDPAWLAGLRHKRHLGYDPEPLCPQLLARRTFDPSPSGEGPMSINSRQKGKKGELEAKDDLNAVLPRAHARRSQQFRGTEEGADLLAAGLPNLWLEVKRVERLNVDATMAASVKVCGKLLPVILHRKNNGEWLVTCRLKDWPDVSVQVMGAT